MTLRGSGQAVWISGSGETGWEIIEKEDGKGETGGENIIIICSELVRSLIPLNRYRQSSSAAITSIFIPVSSAEHASGYPCRLQNSVSVSLLFYLRCHGTGLLFMFLSPTCPHPFVIVPSLPTCISALLSLNFTRI
jgi:hypothetical protein